MYRDDVIRTMATNGNLSYTELRALQPKPSTEPSVATLVDCAGFEEELSQRECQLQRQRERNMQRVQQ